MKVILRKGAVQGSDGMGRDFHRDLSVLGLDLQLSSFTA